MSSNERARIHVGVLFGGPSDEYEVSCNSAASVVHHLDRNRFAVTPIRISKAGAWIVGNDAASNGGADAGALLRSTPDEGAGAGPGLGAAIAALERLDVVFPVLHGPYGEDGTVQALCELIGVPYVGSGVFSSAAGIDKQQTKRLLAAEGMAVAKGIVVEDDGAAIDRAALEALGLPCFVKPARSGSSVGVSKVNDWAGLDAALELARRSGPKIMIEEAVPGREVDVAVVEYPDGRVVAGPPLEILLPGSTAFFDYDAKYNDKSVVFKIPAELDPPVAALLSEQAIQAFRILGCNGLLRVDFFLRPEGGRLVPVINEVNTMPGLTAMSQVPRMMQAAGVSYPDFLATLIDTARATVRPISIAKR
ncbi:MULTISPECIES: D-alanine--D-alanine ligase family protein [Rhodomicrobium]|uniref:D-alanine--D-alanine ligase family protein n=1 Tax=Rhodomicrobium TaxID=1068 RepID=UPI000B4B6DEB|nr:MULTISPECIES: D-alanine--D-alanine ligase family protein [Rhodomicrobium]